MGFVRMLGLIWAVPLLVVSWGSFWWGASKHISTAAAAAKDASSRRLINTCCGAMGLSAQGVGDEEQGGKEEQGAFYPCRFPMEES